jgi:hypothetical protein
MNLNLVSYAFFFPTMVYIAVRVAQVCHKHGEVWMMRLFGDRGFVRAVNNILLVGCYTVNAGYVAVVVAAWEPVTDVPQMLATLSTRIAIILFSLAGLHYMNITVLMVWSRIVRKRMENRTQHDT